MGLKAKVKALRIARDCWNGTTTSETKDQCRALGCPYVETGTDCAADALIDAVALVEILWKERKEKKRIKRGKGGGNADD